MPYSQKYTLPHRFFLHFSRLGMIKTLSKHKIIKPIRQNTVLNFVSKLTFHQEDSMCKILSRLKLQLSFLRFCCGSQHSYFLLACYLSSLDFVVRQKLVLKFSICCFRLLLLLSTGNIFFCFPQHFLICLLYTSPSPRDS